tara:strand:+ start:69529 stop:70596 length:1068 start_codon:yes stop_codon:yes gene_type:complete
VDDARPTPVLEDLEGTRTKLEQWITQQRGHAVSITDLRIPEATGMSNVTLLFDVSWQENGNHQTEPYVGRLQPSIARPVFPDYDLSQQYQVMASVAANSDIPVPALRGLETSTALLGVQFYLMKREDGRIPTDMPPYHMDGWMMHETSLEQRASLWVEAIDTMARFHRLDYKTLGFDDWLNPGKTPLQQQLDYWQDYLDWAMEGKGHTTGQAALDWLRDNQPTDEPTTLCWGDARLANIIFKPSLQGIAAVLDWEMATLGNPVQDLAWFNQLDATFAEGLGLPRLEGLPSYAQTITQWEETSGHSARHYEYYRIFAAMRFGLLLSRIMLATGQDGEVQDNFAIALLRQMLDQVRA